MIFNNQHISTSEFLDIKAQLQLTETQENAVQHFLPPALLLDSTQSPTEWNSFAARALDSGAIRCNKVGGREVKWKARGLKGVECTSATPSCGEDLVSKTGITPYLIIHLEIKPFHPT